MDASIETNVLSALEKLKVAVHQKFPAEIQNYEIRSETDGNYTVMMDVGDAAHINCSVRSEFGNMILRSESQPAGVDEETLEEIGNDLITKIGNARMTSYDGILAVMKAVSFGKEKPQNVERKIFNEVMSFIQIIVRNQGALAGENESGVEYEQELGNETADDPFGFDKITEEDLQAIRTEKETTDTDLMPDNNPEERKEDIERGIEIAMDKSEERQIKLDETGKNDAEQIGPATPPGKEEKTENELLLDGLLHDFESQQNGSDVAMPTLSQEENKTDANDPLEQEDTYRGNDPYGLIKKTREYQETAREAIGRIHDILAGLYPTMYQFAVDLYDRNDQLAQNERNIQIKLDTVGSRQHEIDLAEAELLASQQSLLQERTKFNEYKESVRSVLSDYDVKCHLIKEQEDEIKLLKYDLAEQKKAVERYRTQIAEGAITGAADHSEEDTSVLINENEKLKEEITILQGRVGQYRQIIETFRQCQEEWNRKEADLKLQLEQKKDTSAETNALKQELSQANEQIKRANHRADELEDLLRDAEKKERDQNLRALSSEQRVKDLEEHVLENKKKADTLESQVKEAENKLSVYEQESNIAHCATVIQQDLSSIGIQISPVSGAAEMILEADYEGCSIAVNVELSMIYVSKGIRKPVRYTRQISDLNKLDIRTAYNIGDQEITCRSMYRKSGDVVSQVKDIMDAMKEFK